MEGQPTAWSFVQDLKAMNDAVHARAPVVPDIHITYNPVTGI